jgi:hypothetical protein
VATAIGALVALARAAANTADALGMDGLADKLRGAADRMENFKWKVQAQLSGMGDMGRAAGSALGQGLAAGIAASGEVAIATARNTVNRINAMMRATGEISSPSKVTTRIGEQLAEGLAVGLDKGSRSAVAASVSLVGEAVTPMASPTGGNAPRAATGNTYNIYGATDPEAVVRAIQTYERRNGSGWRA